MKKVYGLIVEDTLLALKNDDKEKIEQMLKICTLDEIEEVIRRYEGKNVNLVNYLEGWIEGKRTEISEFIKFINESFSEEYFDHSYSIDFLNSLRRCLGYEMRFYKNHKKIDNQIEFLLDENELRIDSIICNSIKRQRDKNSKLRGYENSVEERKYQLLYASLSIHNKKNNNVKKVINAINNENQKKKPLESLLNSLSIEELRAIEKKDRDFNYIESKEQMERIINSYGYDSKDIKNIDFKDFND